MKRVGCILLYVLLTVLWLTACDESRLYEMNHDFPERYWLVNEKPKFEFNIDNTDVRYNLYGNLRNEVAYPFSRIFFTYHLTDSTGLELNKALSTQFLFDKKTGKPFGSSALGDIYDHQFLLMENYQFRRPGKYTVQFEQFMRTDTLEGMLSVGLRVERVE
jgi:gliding motility-associated lipoprotein GldH